MKKLLIIFFCLLPWMTLAYSGELEIKNLQFQIEQIEKSQDDYKQIIYWTLWFIWTFFLAFNWFSLYQNWKIDKKELKNIKDELEGYFKKELLEVRSNLTSEIKKDMSQSISSIELDLLETKIVLYKSNKDEVYWQTSILEHLKFTVLKDKYFIDYSLDFLEEFLNEYKIEEFYLGEFEDFLSRIKEEKYKSKIEKIKNTIHKN